MVGGTLLSSPQSRVAGWLWRTVCVSGEPAVPGGFASNTGGCEREVRGGERGRNREREKRREREKGREGEGREIEKEREGQGRGGGIERER